MPLQSLTRGLSETTKNNPVSPLEQLLGSVGLKVSRFSPANSIYPLAKDWKDKYGAENGLPPDKGVYPTSIYTPLKYALEDGDYDTAARQWKQLIAQSKAPGKTARGLVESINAPFTGGRATDQMFYQTLSDHDKQVYDAAVARRTTLMERFGKLQDMIQAQGK
jgi:hypothetical protein